MEPALIVLACMIFYDLSLHLLEWAFGRKKAENLRYYWPCFKIKGKFNRKFYTIFWAIYWGIAFILVLYLINKF